MRASVLLLAAASVAVASAETVELFGAGDEGDQIRVYPIATGASATTYLMGCPVQSANEENCLFLNPIHYTIGPSTVQMQSIMPDLTLHQDCAYTGKTRAVCTVKYSGPGTSNFESDTDQTETTLTLTGTNAKDLWGPATVVDDVTSIFRGDKASIGPAPTSTGDSIPPATTGPGASSAPTGTPTGTAGTTGTTGTTSGAVETSQSTGGMPQITGSAGWAVGGVAAAVALAAF